jgi:hypothetical protein
MRSLTITALALLAGGVGTGPHYEPALRYLRNGYPFATEEARRNLASVSNLHQILDWPIATKIKHYQLFYFRSTWGTHPSILEVLAVGSEGEVLRLADKEAFSRLLVDERLVPINPEGAVEMSLFYMRVSNISQVINYKLADGVRIIKSVDEIPSSLDERRRVEALVEIVAPWVEPLQGGRYRYNAYTWQREGSGAVDQRTLVFGPNGLESHDVKVIITGIGLFEAIQ